MNGLHVTDISHSEFIILNILVGITVNINRLYIHADVGTVHVVTLIVYDIRKH